MGEVEVVTAEEEVAEKPKKDDAGKAGTKNAGAEKKARGAGKNFRHLRRSGSEKGSKPSKEAAVAVEEEVEVEDTAETSDPTEVAVTAEEEVEEKTKKDDAVKRGTKNAGGEKG